MAAEETNKSMCKVCGKDITYKKAIMIEFEKQMVKVCYKCNKTHGKKRKAKGQSFNRRDGFEGTASTRNKADNQARNTAYKTSNKDDG